MSAKNKPHWAATGTAMMLTAVFLVWCGGGGCVRQEQPQPAAEESQAPTAEDLLKAKNAAEKEAVRQALNELVTRHNVFVNWGPLVIKKRPDRERSAYRWALLTLEIQDALSHLRGRPVIMVCYVKDVYRKAGGFYVCADTHYAARSDGRPVNGVVNYWPGVLVLEVEEDVARETMRLLQEDALEVFAFVVHPLHLEVVHQWKYKAETIHIRKSQEGYGYVGIESDSDIGGVSVILPTVIEPQVVRELEPQTILTGRAIDFLFLGNHWDIPEKAGWMTTPSKQP